MITRLLARWADEAVAAENKRLAGELESAQSTIRIQQLEIDELESVIARNHKRVEAGTAIAARKIAGGNDAG